MRIHLQLQDPGAVSAQMDSEESRGSLAISIVMRESTRGN